MEDMAKNLAAAIFSAVEEFNDSDLGKDSFFESFSEQVRPWLNTQDPDVQGRVVNLMNRRSSLWTTSSPGPIEDLRNAVVAMQLLIGMKGSLLHGKLWSCSVEKIKELTAGLTLGAAFSSLDSSFTTWQKSTDTNCHLTDEVKGLVAEAELLLQAAKIVLACQSGCLPAAEVLCENRFDSTFSQSTNQSINQSINILIYCPFSSPVWTVQPLKNMYCNHVQV